MTAAAHVSYPAEGVGMILMDNPPRNFGTYDLLEKIYAGLEEVKRAGCKVVLLASDNPDYFMAHAYLSEIIGAYSGAKISGDPLMWRKVTHELERGPLISISVNNAQAWGGGAELSWACNLRMAARSSTYAQIEVLLGLIPGGGGTVRLARLIGLSKALEIFLTGEPMTAEDAARIGLANKIVDDSQLREEAIAWGARIAKAPKWSLQACKRGLYQAWDMHYEDGLRVEGYIFNSTMRPATIEIMKKIQARYDEGADSWAAYELR